MKRRGRIMAEDLQLGLVCTVDRARSPRGSGIRIVETPGSYGLGPLVQDPIRERRDYSQEAGAPLGNEAWAGPTLSRSARLTPEAIRRSGAGA